MEPNEIADLTDAEIEAKVADIRASESVLYNAKQALMMEAARRKAAGSGAVIESALLHERFGLSVMAYVAIQARIPDSDWVEGEYDVQDFISKVNGALPPNEGNATVTFRGHKYNVKDHGDRFDVRPHIANDIEAWRTLLDLVAHRLSHNTYHLDVVEPILPMIRDTIRGKEK